MLNKIYVEAYAKNKNAARVYLRFKNEQKKKKEGSKIKNKWKTRTSEANSLTVRS